MYTTPSKGNTVGGANTHILPNPAARRQPWPYFTALAARHHLLVLAQLVVAQPVQAAKPLPTCLHPDPVQLQHPTPNSYLPQSLYSHRL